MFLNAFFSTPFHNNAKNALLIAAIGNFTF